MKITKRLQQIGLSNIEQVPLYLPTHTKGTLGQAWRGRVVNALLESGYYKPENNSATQYPCSVE